MPAQPLNIIGTRFWFFSASGNGRIFVGEVVDECHASYGPAYILRFSDRTQSTVALNDCHRVAPEDNWDLTTSPSDTDLRDVTHARLNRHYGWPPLPPPVPNPPLDANLAAQTTHHSSQHEAALAGVAKERVKRDLNKQETDIMRGPPGVLQQAFVPGHGTNLGAAQGGPVYGYGQAMANAPYPAIPGFNPLAGHIMPVVPRTTPGASASHGTQVPVTPVFDHRTNQWVLAPAHPQAGSHSAGPYGSGYYGPAPGPSDSHHPKRRN